MRPGNGDVPDLIFREVRRLRWIARVAVWLLIAAYIPWDYYLLGYTWKIISLHLVPAIIASSIIVETIFVASLRLQKRGRYPSALAVELGAISDLRLATEAGLRLSARWLGAEAGLLVWLDERGNRVPVTACGTPDDWTRRFQPPTSGYDPVRLALEQQRPIIGSTSRCPYWRDLFERRRSAAYVPLTSRDRVLAVMTLVGPYFSFDLRDTKLLEGLGIVIGLSLDNLRLNQREYESIMQVLCHALDMRDRATEGHSQRVSHLAGLVAQQMGHSPEEVRRIQQAAVLHDIGKIGVADAILSKPAALTDEEWEEMRRHPHLGYQIIRDIAVLRDVADIVYSHHERFDGSGYPRGLKGEEIPLGARIFSVVDPYDAMTSHRPYRRARAHEHAVAEIRKCSGTQFDPSVVQAFLELERRGIIHPNDDHEDFEPDVQMTVGEAPLPSP